jgi:hypothetical protein
LSLDGGVVWVVVVGVTREDGVIIVRLVLDERIKPAVSNKDVLEIDLVGSTDVLRVLLEEVLCEKSGWDYAYL